jgi:hypothetical protein
MKIELKKKSSYKGHIISIIYFVIIFAVQTFLISINYQQIDYQIIPLVLSNYLMIFPVSKLINKINTNKLLIIDLIASYCIHFSSSFYHFCNFTFVYEFCFISSMNWTYLDYYFSYLMVSLGVQYLLFENVSIKIFFYIISITIQGFLIYLDYENVLLNLSISLIKLVFIIFYNLFNRNKITKQNINSENETKEFTKSYCFYYQNTNYIFNIYYLISNLFCIFIACLGRFYFLDSNYYWWAHSFCWHFFIFLACFFNYSMIDYKTTLSIQKPENLDLETT